MADLSHRYIDQKNILVLGACNDITSTTYTDKTDLELWKLKYSDYNIEGISLGGRTDNPDCHIGNFNSLLFLSRLENDKYDIIVFDRSTVKFLKWTSEHLKIIKQKLKDGGEFFLPNHAGSGLRYIILGNISDLPITKVNVRRWLDQHGYQRYTPWNNIDLFIGTYGPTLIFPKEYFFAGKTNINPDYAKYMSEYRRELMDNQNRPMLYNIFSEQNVNLDRDNYPTRLDIDPKESSDISEYYVIRNDETYISTLPTLDSKNMVIKLIRLKDKMKINPQGDYEEEVNNYQYIADNLISPSDRFKQAIDKHLLDIRGSLTQRGGYYNKYQKEYVKCKTKYLMIKKTIK